MARVLDTFDGLVLAPERVAARQGRLGRTLAASASMLVKLSPAILFLAFWEVAAGRLFDTYYFSQPSAILQRLVEFEEWKAWTHIQVTMTEMLMGYAIGGVLGIILGYLFGVYERVAEIFEPYIMGFYSIPIVAKAPLIIMWFGIGIYSKVFIVAFLVFFTVFYEVYLGAKSVSEEHVNLARIMGASQQQIIRKIVWPTVFPYMMLGFRLGLPKMVTGAVVGEFVAAKAGLGYYIHQAASMFDPAGIFAGIIVLLVIILVINVAYQIIETKTLRWTTFEQRLAED